MFTGTLSKKFSQYYSHFGSDFQVNHLNNQQNLIKPWGTNEMNIHRKNKHSITGFSFKIYIFNAKMAIFQG